tara:strand:- start:2970 stop:3446 length:477 start_codon:yes stop_codon:yes gene_type:complete
MNKKKYIYDKCDIKKNKNLYQYSEFQGVKFLNIFLKSRKKLLKKLTKDQQHFEDKYKVKLNIKKIVKLCKLFEIKKKIFIDKNEQKEFNLSDYINFSYEISIYLLNKIDYSILSTFLKINDLIAFNYSKKKIYNNKKIIKTLLIENLIINRIIDEKIK